VDGRWPDKKSGYIENPFAPQGKRVSASAYFETPIAVLAEFHLRVDMCGRDGEAFLCCRCLKWDCSRVRLLMGLNDIGLDRKLQWVFKYIVGRRKNRPYQEFIRH